MPGGAGQPTEDVAPSQMSPAILRRLARGTMHSPVGIAITDKDGYLEWSNLTFSRLTGQDAADLQGRHPVEVVVAPACGAAEADRLRSAVDAGDPVNINCTQLRADGSPGWISFRMGPGNAADEDAYYLVAIEDITEQVRHEEEARRAAQHAEAFAEALRSERELLASVLATIPHVVFWKDTDHRYLGCNEAYARLRGLEHEGELTGRQEADLHSDPLGAFIADMEVRVLESGAPVVDHSITVPTAEGQTRMMVFSLLPRHTDGPAPAGVIGVGADFTRMTALERQLATATRLESIGQLAAGLAHEINTPIQYVSDNALFLADSFTDVLEALRSIANLARGAEQAPGPGSGAPTTEDLRVRLGLVVDGLDLDFLASEIPDALEQTLEGVARVAEIVRAMKEFSHPGQGRVDTDINRAVESTVQVCRNEWKYVAEMRLDLDPALGLVPCYEGELKQVILNLVVNAAHAITERREQTDDPALGRIEITTRRDGELIRISITDTGTGMDETTKQRIFDPFFTTKDVGKGTGQGLAMAHSCIVGRHGGSIDVVTRPGCGTTFHVELPATVDGVTPKSPATAGGW